MTQETSITYRQLLQLVRQDIAWVRIELPTHEERNFMSPQAIRESVTIYGDRTVCRVYPGYGFVIVTLDFA